MKKAPKTEQLLTQTNRHFYWSSNGLGPGAIFDMLQDHITNLVAAYQDKGMEREAELFQEHLNSLKRRQS